MEEKIDETKENSINGVKVIEKEEKNNKVEEIGKENNKVEGQEKKEDSNKNQEQKKQKEDENNKAEEQKKEQQEEKIIETNKNKQIKVILIILIALILIIAIFSTVFAIINMESSKIMKGIAVGRIDVSNLSKEAAQEALKEYYSSKDDNEIYLTYGEFETTITYKALEVEYQVGDAFEKAYNIGRSGNIFKDNIDILDCFINGRTINVEAMIDKDMINQIAQNINNSIEGAVVQSSYYIEGEKLIITSGKEGLKVNEKELLEKVSIAVQEDFSEETDIEIPVYTSTPEKIDLDKIHQEVYKEVKNAYYTKDPFTIYTESDGIDFDIEQAKEMLTEEKEEYEINLIITKPTKTVKEIGTEAFPDLLTTFSTNYVASNVNRTTNLRLAAQKINGTVLLPGEEFSYNKIVGERTIQAGYKEAAVYSNGEVVNGLGGGICQISSTLYDAVVMANLNVTQRRNHQFVTSYLPAGKDATVVYGSQDFKFVNTRKYPIRITATVQGGVATIQIWGVREEVEYEISIETRKTATIAPTTQYIQDPSLPAGSEVVKQSGSNGCKVEAYKVVKLNGQVVSKTLLSKDTYNAMKRVVRVGTGVQ